MIEVDSDQIGHRRTWIPETLSDLALSDDLGREVQRVSDQFGVSGEQRRKVDWLVGLHIMGYIRRRDLAGEIAASAAIPLTTAERVVDELERTLFAQHRVEIERIYTPPGPIPKWSPYLMEARNRQAEEHLRRAYDLILPVIASLPPARNPQQLLELELAGVEPPISTKPHPLQLAYLEYRKASDLDARAVLVLSEYTYVDVNAVLEMIVHASIQLRIPMSREDASPRSAAPGCLLGVLRLLL